MERKVGLESIGGNMNDGILGNRDVTCVEVWWPAEFWSVPDSMVTMIKTIFSIMLMVLNPTHKISLFVSM